MKNNNTDKSPAVRKHQQIESTNRTMFTWVAAAAIIISVAIVLSISLFQRMAFNQKVIDKKNQAVSNLKHNNEVVDELRNQARLVNTNSSLLETDRPEGAQPISVVLDALPAQANSSALGASLQKKLLDGVTIDSLTVDSADEGSSSTSAEDGEITFSFSVSSDNPDDIKQVLRRLELSIRTIHVQTLTIEQRGSKINLSVKGVAYYSPEKKVELETKQVRP